MEKVIARTEHKRQRMHGLVAWFEDPDAHPPPARFAADELTSRMTVAEKVAVLVREYPVVRFWNQRESFHTFVDRILFVQMTLEDMLAAFEHSVREESA